MDEANRTNYEQEDPKHPTEQELIDRVTRRLDEALDRATEAEERMARNTGRSAGGGRGPDPQG